jgi:hypothetical protein
LQVEVIHALAHVQQRGRQLAQLPGGALALGRVAHPHARHAHVRRSAQLLRQLVDGGQRPDQPRCRQLVQRVGGGVAPAGEHPGAVLDRVGDVHREHLRPERVDAQLEGRDHAEVASAAAQRPEQVGVLVGARPDLAAVGEDDLGGDEAVDRHLVAPALVGDAAAQRKARHAGLGHHAARSRKPKRRGDAIDVGPRGAALHVDRATGGVDADAAHRRKVDHKAVVDDGGARHVVPAAADVPRWTAGQEGDAAHHDRLPSTSRQKASTRAFHSSGTSWKG